MDTLWSESTNTFWSGSTVVPKKLGTVLAQKITQEKSAIFTDTFRIINFKSIVFYAKIVYVSIPIYIPPKLLTT